MSESDLTQAWRARFKQRVEAEAETFEVTLPSGLRAKVRRISVLDVFSMGGIIPNSLTPVVVEWFGLPDKALQSGGNMDQEAREFLAHHVAEYHRIRDLVCQVCLLDPKVWITADEALANPDAVPIRSLDAIDLGYLFACIHGAGAVVESLFRGREGGSGDGPGQAGTLGTLAGRNGDGDGHPPPARDRSDEAVLAGLPG